MDRSPDSSSSNRMHRPWLGWLGGLSMRHSADKSMEERYARCLRSTASLLGIVASLVGVGHLVAWLGGYLTQSGMTALIMKTNAALCLMLVGVALMLLASAQAGSTRRWAARACAALSLLVGLLTFAENLSGWNFAIDQLLAVETPGAMGVASPNRMGIPASLSFTLIGLALLILSRRDRRGVRVAQALALAVCLIALLPTIGFLYGAEQFYGIAQYTGIAWPTAVSLLLLGLGLLCARPAEGLMALMTASGPGGVAIRRLLPVFIVLPLLLGWLRLAGERAGLFDAATGTGLMMLTFISVFSALAYHTGRRANRSAEALRESEERFRAAYQQVAIGIEMLDLDGRFLRGNGWLSHMLGYREEELQQRTFAQITHPDDLPKELPILGELLAGEIPNYSIEKRYLHKDGHAVWVRVTSSLVRTSTPYRISIIEDITEQKKAQAERERLLHEVSVHAAQLQEANENLAAVNEELAASNEELQATTEELRSEIEDRKKAEATVRELNATLEGKVAQRTAELTYRARQLQRLTLELTQAEERERRRIAVILHEDLQQQIAGAKFHLSLVRNRAKDDRVWAEVDEVDAILREAVEKSRRLSHDLSPAVMHMNDLAEVLRWLVNQVRAQQGLSVTLVVSGDMMLQSEALAVFLFRAAQEMLLNVIKHAHVREAAIRVKRIGRCVCVCVSDQGRGFDPRELRETPGVGLFSIRERTELLGGRMKVKSTQGMGSRFSITVPDSVKAVGVGPRAYPLLTQAGSPAYPASVGTDDQEKEGGHGGKEGNHGGKEGNHGGLPLRVLLVDDHDIVRQGLAALLQEAPGIEVVGEAPDGREAINIAMELQPDVVIMDVSMPLLSGDQATRQIKGHLPKTRVVALSMYDDADKKQSMFEAGAEDYILKTISADDLIAAIRGKHTVSS